MACWAEKAGKSVVRSSNHMDAGIPSVGHSLSPEARLQGMSCHKRLDTYIRDCHDLHTAAVSYVAKAFSSSS